MTLPPGDTISLEAGQKSSQLNPGSPTRSDRSTVLPLLAMLAAQDPYRYTTSGYVPAAIAEMTFGNMSSTVTPPELTSTLTSLCEALNWSTSFVSARAAACCCPCQNWIVTVPPCDPPFDWSEPDDPPVHAAVITNSMAMPLTK